LQIKNSKFEGYTWFDLKSGSKVVIEKTKLGWFDGIGLGPKSVLLLMVSGSILSGANLNGLI
jgi:hypothetical protein